MHGEGMAPVHERRAGERIVTLTVQQQSNTSVDDYSPCIDTNVKGQDMVIRRP